MDIVNITEIVNQNPGIYFIVGLVVGYYMRNIIAHYRVKRPGRYQGAVNANRRAHEVPTSGSNEPYFDWADAAVKTLTSRQNTISLNQQSEEV